MILALGALSKTSRAVGEGDLTKSAACRLSSSSPHLAGLDSLVCYTLLASLTLPLLPVHPHPKLTLPPPRKLCISIRTWQQLPLSPLLSYAMYIQSLPVEILLHIFSFAVLEWSDWGYWEYEPRRRTLYAASLVCRSWRRLAQPLLWEEVHLWTPSRVSEFVAGTAATSLTTRELRLWGRFAADGDPGIARAVDACVGVQKLLLREFCGLDSQTLFLPQPAGQSLSFISKRLSSRPH